MLKNEVHYLGLSFGIIMELSMFVLLCFSVRDHSHFHHYPGARSHQLYLSVSPAMPLRVSNYTSPCLQLYLSESPG
jgi:hypothetical protein